jgi:NRPS condensation-like uncharacterized protein
MLTLKPRNANRMPAEILDQVQYFLSFIHDHQIRAVIKFDGLMDESRMAKAVGLTLDMIPILKYHFLEGFLNAYWEEDVNSDLSPAFSLYLNEHDMEPFLTQLIDPRKGPQIRVGLFRSSTDTLCVLINHMVTDAPGFKDCLYLLADNYRHLMEDPEYKPPKEPIVHNRALIQVMEGFSKPELFRIACLNHGQKQPPSGPGFFPGRDSEDGKPRIISMRIAGEIYDSLVQYGKIQGATINDLLLALCYQVFSEMIRPAGGKLNIGMTVDLRRYLPKRTTPAVYNLMCVESSRIKIDKEEGFDGILRKVHSDTTRLKQNYIGLNGYTKYLTLLSWFPYATRKTLFDWYFRHPMLLLTNLAAIDQERLNFGATPVADAYLSGSLKYPPYCQLAVSGYGRSLTISLNYFDQGPQHCLAQDFFTRFTERLFSQFAR